MSNARRLSEAQRLAKAIAVICRVKHFADLPLSTQEAIARVVTPRHFDNGQVLFLEGEPAEALYILESGWVKATRISPEGREQAVLVVNPGEIFGDVAVFTGTSYPGTAVALEAVDVWRLERAEALALVTRYPEFAMTVIRRLGERVLYYVELVEDLSLRSVEARLASTLLKHVSFCEGRCVVLRRTWATFDEMAARLGTVRDVLSRALKTLEEQGLLRVEKHEIVILDPERLAAHGEF